MGVRFAADLRQAVRAIVRTPVTSITAVFMLTLALGTSSAAFVLVNSLLIRGLPVADPERLVLVSSDYAVSHGFTAGAGWSQSMWAVLEEHAQAFAGALAWHPAPMTLGLPGSDEPIDGLFVSSGFFSTLGVPAARGRLFAAADDPGSSPLDLVAVISDRLWQRRFGRSPEAIGSLIRLDGMPVTVVGVTPASFHGLEVGRSFDVALPFGAEPVIRGRSQPNAFLLLVMLRLAEGQSLPAATAALRALQPNIVPAGAPAHVREPFTLVPAAGGAANPGAPKLLYFTPVLVLLVGAALVLILACLNLANVFLVRAIERERDLRPRLASGASPWRLVSPILLETVLLAMTAGAAGLLVAWWAARGIQALTPVTLDLTPDWRVAAFTAVTSLAAGLAAGAAPAARTLRVARTRGATMADGRTPGRVSRAAAIAQIVQIAVALVVLTTAGLLVRTFATLANAPFGFDRDSVMVARVDTARSPRGEEHRFAWFQQLADSVAAAPGVAGAAASFWTPLTGAGIVRNIDMRTAEGTVAVAVVINFVTTGWFDVYGTRLVAGRDVAAGDTSTAAPVAIVNEAYVRRFLPAVHPIGAAVMGHTVVGVAADAVSRPAGRIPGTPSQAVRDPVPPTVYVPLVQAGRWDLLRSTTIYISARPASGTPAGAAPAIRSAVLSAAPEATITFRALADDVADSLAQERLLAMLASFFAVTSVGLVALGLYGVVAAAGRHRAREIGIRRALGATRGRIVRDWTARASGWLALGTVMGLAVTAALTHQMSALLFGVAALDPPTFAASALLLGAAAMAAVVVPAYRSSRVDPASLLRQG